jgi:hypothetical protein
MKNCKGGEIKRPWPNSNVQSQHLSGGTEINKENSQDGQSSDRDVNQEPPECEAGALTTKFGLRWLISLTSCTVISVFGRAHTQRPT